MLCVNVFYVALFMYLSIFIGKLYINGVDYLSSLHGYWARFLIAMLIGFYRKDRYSINLQLICDDKRRIWYFVIGFPGSMYDGDVFSQCLMYQSPEEFFSLLFYADHAAFRKGF